MSRFFILSMAAVAASLGAIKVMVDPPVNLQAVTPGVAQSGHLNITGTATAGMFKGAGSLLTGLNASALASGTITLTGTSSTYMIRGTNTSASANAAALIGIASSSSGVTYGGWFESKSSAGRALFGYASSTSGATYGIYAQNNSNAGRAGFGVATSLTGNTYGGWFQSNSPDGIGLYAKNQGGGVAMKAESTGTALSVIGKSNFSGASAFADSLQVSGPYVAVGARSTEIGSNEILRLSHPTTTGSAGVYTSTGTGGKPYYGYNNVTNDAFTYLASAGALRFNVHGTETLGLYPNGDVGLGTTVAPTAKVDIRGDDIARASLVSITNGGPGGGYAAARRGLLAQASGSSGLLTLGVQGVGGGTSNPCYGLAGTANGTGQNYGVYGFSPTNASSYAGYFDGRLYAVSATSGVKSFVIDHPLDPANKYLEHSSVESDERKNMYDGVVTTDRLGYATVSLPSWFEALNEDFRYQLTVVENGETEGFTLVKVVEELKDQKFKIKTSVPNTKVSWQITGRRHDPTSEQFPLMVERDKGPLEKGKYLVPAAYGKDGKRGLAGSIK
ncbi:MAG: hypothetical protein ABL949_08095 [Fimbriimonadaceae bacterium]